MDKPPIPARPATPANPAAPTRPATPANRAAQVRPAAPVNPAAPARPAAPVKSTAAVKPPSATASDTCTSGNRRTILLAAAIPLAFCLGFGVCLAFRSGNPTPLAPLPPIAADFDKPAPLRIEAYIDGRDRLILQRNTVQWHRLEWDPPGRVGEQTLPTVINDVPWIPDWPDPAATDKPDPKNYSAKFESLKPPLPASSASSASSGPRAPVQIKRITGRGKISIIQQPSSSNDDKLIIEFNDDSFKGPGYYIVDVTY